MKTNSSSSPTPKKANWASNLFASITILICLCVGYLVWKYIMGDPANFEGNDPEHGMPLDGNILGVIYKGGFIVPILLGLLLTGIVVSIERAIVLARAKGKKNLEKFVQNVQVLIAGGQIAEAKVLCDEQQGSVANVIKAGLVKYEDVVAEGFDSEEAAEMIGKEIEEATALEMPSLQKNMMILATLVSIGTLFGLTGTVLGMIKAFAGLAVAGTPDQAQLATGISEALINTATGILTSIVATISYNFFTSKIDTLTYFIDESSSTIIKSYRAMKSGK